MNEKQLADAFNEWMRRYTEDPQEFARDFQSVTKFLADKAAGVEPTYGQVCAAYVVGIIAGHGVAGDAPAPPAHDPTFEGGGGGSGGGGSSGSW